MNRTKTKKGQSLSDGFYTKKTKFINIAKLLWPIETEKELVECFKRILKEETYGIEYYIDNVAVMNSWIYKRLLQLKLEKNPVVTDEVSKKLFEVEWV